MARLRTEFPEANGTVALDAQPLREALVGEREPAALDPDGQRRLRAADRLRQPRQPAAGESDGPRPRDRHPPGDRRGPRTRRPAAARREHGARADRRRRAACWPASSFSTPSSPGSRPAFHASPKRRWTRASCSSRSRPRPSRASSSAWPRPLQLARRAPASVLRNDARTSTGRAPLRAILVVGELAVALVLLAGAGLLIRSFVLMQRVDPGFATDRVLTFQVRMEGPAYAKGAARIAFVNGVVERLKALPGATDAAASSYAPIVGRGTGAWFNIIARPLPPGTTPPGVPYRVITSDYFKAMQIPLVRGRLLDDRDGLNGTPSVVISESLARRFWAPLERRSDRQPDLPRRAGQQAVRQRDGRRHREGREARRARELADRRRLRPQHADALVAQFHLHRPHRRRSDVARAGGAADRPRDRPVAGGHVAAGDDRHHADLGRARARVDAAAGRSSRGSRW